MIIPGSFYLSGSGASTASPGGRGRFADAIHRGASISTASDAHCFGRLTKAPLQKPAVAEIRPSAMIAVRSAMTELFHWDGNEGVKGIFKNGGCVFG